MGTRLERTLLPLQGMHHLRDIRYSLTLTYGKLRLLGIWAVGPKALLQPSPLLRLW